jgi:hypothetical protein
MQILQAQFSQPIDPSAFLHSWTREAQLDAAPQVDFDFQPDSRYLEIRIHANPTSPWPMENFQRTFAIALHRIAPECEVSWP